MEDRGTQIVLDKKTDFTAKRLLQYLNETHGHKTSGKPFTIGDVAQYVKKGKLAKAYGNHPITVHKNDDIGLKILTVHFDKTV